MSKRNFKVDRIEITEFAFLKIQSWAQALNEVCFVAYGNENRIVDAVRLLNIATAPRNYFDYSRYELSQTKKKIKSLGFQMRLLGHSHPSRFHLRRPSKNDWLYLPKKSIQLIVFPNELQIRVWKFEDTYFKTIQNEIPLETIN